MKNFVKNDLRVIGEWSFDEKSKKDVFRVKGGNFDSATINWWASKKTINFQSAPNIQEQLKSLYDEKYKPSDYSDGHVVQHKSTHSSQKKTIFIVYGHDKKIRDELELFLRRLNLEPYILSNSRESGKTIIEALEGQIGKDHSANFGIVLMTPDDVGYKRDDEGSKKERARQNVILETGMLLSSLTRKRMAIVVKRGVEVPSDIISVQRFEFDSNLVKEIGATLGGVLIDAGFDITLNDLSKATTDF